LIVEMKAVVGMSDGVDAFVQRQPLRAGTGRGGEETIWVVSGKNRILCEGMQDVREHQFLMLLLMIEADFDERADVAKLGFVRLAEELYDGRNDICSIGRDLLGARPRDVATAMPRMTRTGADIIGIEQDREVGMEGLMVRTM